MILTLENDALKVVFPFGGQVHEVRLPPYGNRWSRENPEVAKVALRAEATIVLQCLSSRAALELQHAMAASGPLPQMLRMEVFSFAAELHGSFADLAKQLQECVRYLREDGEFSREPATGCTAALLQAAAVLGNASAAQQLLLIDPSVLAGEVISERSPAQLAADSFHGAAVLGLLLEAAPNLVVWSAVEMEPHQSWTLMHTAAGAGNAEAIRLLLRLAPELASARTDSGHTPLHGAAASRSPAAVRLLLEAAPQTAVAYDNDGRLPMHWAAFTGSVDCIRLLVDAGAPGLDVPDEVFKKVPLHDAASFNGEAADRLLLARHPAAATVANVDGQLPLHIALRLRALPDAARVLLHVSGLSAQQLLDVLAGVPAEKREDFEPLYADIAAHMPLTPEQWQHVPTPCPSLGLSLPAVLAHSAAEAGLLVAHLWPSDRERLRTAALSLHRLQRTLELCPPIPAALLGRMLALSLSDDL